MELTIEANCIICNNKVELTNEQLKWLSDYIFKYNPDARGADIQQALNLSRGKKCIDNQYHLFILSDKWITEADKNAILIKEDIEKLEKLTNELNKVTDEHEQLRIQLTNKRKIISELKMKAYISESNKNLNITKFQELTGTDNYKGWL